MTDAEQIKHIEGTGIPLRGNNIDTDRIIPARFLKAITFDGLGDHAFEDDRKSMAGHPFSNPAFSHATVLFANENFGSGSSREHAPQALKRWGIGACIGESFSEIFLGNATTIGLPCATAAVTDIETLMALVEQSPETSFLLDLETLALTTAGHTVKLRMPAAVREALLTGQWDATGLLLDNFAQVRKTASALPYIKGF